ncbi:gluzincin family metallopeptidase [Peredibacter starrii]|uniref:Peptidase M1 membrane alanine aminopeptidase domain-containing protein n=1 Tax=Peredibacter starrii TaxID=28202 RepID=A0AAX4HJI5_9BACT|nr:hypothetical protein [Peredibacter starrii]WPU63380.1 hypothetical protein SOO65_11850 [Peredibacter starrii]
MKFFLLGLLFVTSAFASNDLSHRPKSFLTSSGKAVFVDFTTADYTINYDITSRRAVATAMIKFFAPEAGMPIFDSYADPSFVVLNGQNVSSFSTKTPGRETTLRVVNQNVAVGNHTLSVTVPLTTLVDYVDGGVKSAFWASDLDDRRFLERYMPANFEFDQVKMTLTLNFLGAKTIQNVYTNGVVEEVKAGTYKINYPAHYTSSSIFFHTTPASSVVETRYSLKSIDGREIPVVIYVTKSASAATALDQMKAAATDVFQELERDYGAWPHPSLTIYNAGSGGMEYCGATMTSVSAVGHEMFHSYFARGVMPANGNTGWLDEALASWRDKGYQSISVLSGTSMMSNRLYYTRHTDYSAYSFGERFMSYMDNKLSSKGGLKPFMRHMVENRRFAPLFVEEFIQEMSQFYGVSLEDDFKKYTFGTKNKFDYNKSMQTVPHMHQKLSLEQLQELL